MAAPTLKVSTPLNIHLIKQNIESHPAWIGRVSGLKAEKMLRGLKRPYLYVLRGEYEGENKNDYYVSFVYRDFSVKHQPFAITSTSQGWCYETINVQGSFTEASIDNVVHLIMQCHKDECAPLVHFEKKWP